MGEGDWCYCGRENATWFIWLNVLVVEDDPKEY